MEKIDDLGRIIRHVREIFFKNHKITSFGKFHWTPISEKQSTKYFNKSGKELKEQKRRFTIDYFFDEYFEISKELKNQNPSFSSRYYHLLISTVNLHDLTFYIIGDNFVGSKLGEITRYRFQIESFENLESISLIEKRIIAIR